MFGYVNINNSSISVEDRVLYQSYYCGLCKAIGKKSQLFRLGLNNDLTFLSVVLSAVIADEPLINKNKTCIMHRIKKHDEIEFNSVMDYVADMNILLVYLKICDDADDDKKISSRVFRFIFRIRERMLCNKYIDCTKIIKSQLKTLAELEKEKCGSVDVLADCFGKILEAVFCPEFITDKETKKILSWIGYNLGRWIYIIDAYEDVESDRKKGSYNPFIYSENTEDLHEITYEAMTYTLNNIANAYDLLKIYRNDTLIKNILYSGLPGKQESIFKKTEEKNGSL